MYDNELKLFQRSNQTIWTDEHISKSLLDAHLDESNDAASRKPQRRIDIVNCINNSLKPNSKIIDLGCGPGLYAYELGKLGHNVLGVDFNSESINYAQKNKCISDIVEYKYCNYLEDTITGKYDAAIMIFCDFGALVPDEQKLLLKKLHNLLENDGIFIFDVFGKEEIKNKQEKRDWHISKGSDFWNKEPYFLLKEEKLFEKESALGTRYYLINHVDGHTKEFTLWDQYYEENSIKKLLSENGFEVIEINKDIIKYKEETLLIIAKKK
jgi:SAM-dependent methyltransferase